MFYVSAVEYVTFHVLMHMEYALFMLGQRTASGNGKLKIVDEEGEGGGGRCVPMRVAISKLLKPFLANMPIAVGMSTCGDGRSPAIHDNDDMPSLLPRVTA